MGDKEIAKNIVIQDEITYILSLLKIDKFMILENIESNFLTKHLDKSNFEGNYIIVNKFAEELLGKYVTHKG